MESGRLCLHEEQESVYSAEDDVTSFLEKKWRIKFHVIFLFIYVVTFTATVCAMSLSSGPPPVTTDMNDINKVYLTIPPNDTLTCRPFHRFALSEELYISVCADKRPTLIQINQYVDRKPGACATFLTKTQWLYLKRTEGHLEKSIMEFENITKH